MSTVSATRDEKTGTDNSEDDSAADSKESYSGGYGDCNGNEDFNLIHVNSKIIFIVYIEIYLKTPLSGFLGTQFYE